MRTGGRTIVAGDKAEKVTAAPKKDGTRDPRAHGYGEALAPHLVRPKSAAPAVESKPEPKGDKS